MMISLCMSAQVARSLISEKTKDEAYSAPNSLLINKKWFSNGNLIKEIYIFKADKTGEMVIPLTYVDCTFDRVTPIKWSRNHNDLKITNYFNKITYRNLKYKDSSASERTKAEIKRGVQNIINKDKINGVKTANYYIDRLDSKYLILEHPLWGEYLYCTEAVMKEIEKEEKEKKEAEEKRLKEEEEEAAKKAAAEEKRKKEEEEEAAKKFAAEVETKVFDVVEEMPQFPGGQAALLEYLAKNIQIPVDAEENGVQGRVICTFVVERDGSLGDIRVVKSVEPSLDQEAVRVIKSMPKWTPGKENGHNVRVKYTVPIQFRLQ